METDQGLQKAKRSVVGGGYPFPLDGAAFYQIRQGRLLLEEFMVFIF